MELIAYEHPARLMPSLVLAFGALPGIARVGGGTTARLDYDNLSERPDG
jgi:hypothetical protein